jgi:hypothetical protein
VTPGTNLCPNCGADTRPLWAQDAGHGLIQTDLPNFVNRRRRDKLMRALRLLAAIGLGMVLTMVLLILGIFLLCSPLLRPH